MKHNLIALLLVALFAGVAAFFAARLITCRKSSRLPGDLLHNRAVLSQTLRLRADQQQALDDLETALGRRVNEGCSRNCDARRRLAAALTAETPDPELLDGILMDMCRSYEASERTVLEHIQALRGILDDGQRKAFDAMMGRCLCGTGVGDCQASPSP
jgi:hypothetical protein